MLFARCLSKGANRVGADLLLGLYCTEELFDSFPQQQNSQVRRDEDGQIIEIIEKN